MSQELLLLSFGPVQPFLAAARRTRDLANGSKLLLCAVKAAARVLVEKANAELIIPVWNEGDDWAKVDAANLIECLIPSGRGQEAAELAKQAALDFLNSEWSRVAEKYSHLGLDKELGKEQFAALLEFFAGWAPVSGDFEEARQEAGRLLAASKNVRMPGSCPKSGSRAKSPLLPQFESVVKLEKEVKVSQAAQKNLLLGPRETLDGPSLTKRFFDEGGGDISSTRHMAAEALLREGEGSRELTALEELAERVRISPADILHADNDLREELERKLEGEFEDFWKRLLKARRAFLKEHNKGRPARGYYAMIHADGDGMGKARSSLKGIDEHRAFSRAVRDFARAVPAIVADRGGHLVFAGGDDVLALAPLDQAIDLAAELAMKFEECLEGQEAKAPRRSDGKKTLTLSIGLAYAHYSTKLSDIVDWSHTLEGKAKKAGRGRLAIGARVRSGTDLVHVFQWNQKPAEIAGKAMDEMEKSDMPRGFAKEVHDLGHELVELEKHMSDRLPLEHVMGEYRRLCGKKISGRSEDLVSLWMPVLQEPIEVRPGLLSHAQSLKEFGGLLKLCHFVTRLGGEE